MKRRPKIANSMLCASLLLEVDEAQADDGQQHAVSLLEADEAQADAERLAAWLIASGS